MGENYFYLNAERARVIAALAGITDWCENTSHENGLHTSFAVGEDGLRVQVYGSGDDRFLSAHGVIGWITLEPIAAADNIAAHVRAVVSRLTAKILPAPAAPVLQS